MASFSKITGIRHTRSVAQLKTGKRIDIWIGILAIIFSLFGLLMIFESSNVMAFHDFGNKYYYIHEQAIWFLFGVIGMVIVSFVNYKKYYWLAFPAIIITIVSLFAVFIPGIGVKAYGANRWIGINKFNFQPSELAKLTLIFYLAAWFSKKEKGRLMSFFLLLLLIVGLVVLQPDLGTAIILTAIAIFMYFLSGANSKQFLLLIPLVIVVVSLLAYSSPYRLKRVTTFLNPNIDPLGASYHIRQILISLGSGGFWGMGLGASRQKYQFLPEATTDSIFAIIAEELGFLGSMILVFMFIIFLWRIVKITKNIPDLHGFLLASGIFILFTSQILVNLGSMVALFPLTGVPLPFISYGGSNLVISLISVGILLSISRFSSR